MKDCANDVYDTVDDEPPVGDPTYDTVDKPCKGTSSDDSDDIVRPIIPEILPVSVDELGKYVLNCHANGNGEFKNQYKASKSLSECHSTFKSLHAKISNFNFNFRFHVQLNY